jgi:NAD(P)-dependent dehydrogenase (short-subunit alcohol dehydrogenase family)
MANEKLRGKVVVITGATSGFGRGAALAFADAGAYLVLNARRDQELDEVAMECQERGGRALVTPGDVSEPGDVEQIAQGALAQFGRIDVWVNNAGVGALGIFDEVPLADHDQVIRTNLLGALYGSYVAMRQFRQQGTGTLINIASVLGKIPAPYYSSYAASKHGVVGLSTSIRQELSELEIDDIHVCTVLPTSMDTPFFEHAGNYTGHEVEPIPPTYDPAKVIETIVRLATDPEDEVAVGGAGKLFTFSHNIAPGLTEAMLQKQTARTIDKAPPASDTEGAVHEPMGGARVVGGKREEKD